MLTSPSSKTEISHWKKSSWFLSFILVSPESLLLLPPLLSLFLVLSLLCISPVRDSSIFVFLWTVTFLDSSAIYQTLKCLREQAHLIRWHPDRHLPFCSGSQYFGNYIKITAVSSASFLALRRRLHHLLYYRFLWIFSSSRLWRLQAWFALGIYMYVASCFRSYSFQTEVSLTAVNLHLAVPCVVLL